MASIFCATCHLACTWRATHICTTTSTARAGCHWGHRALARGDRWLIGHRFIIQTSYKCHRREKYVLVCIKEMKLSLPSLSKYISSHFNAHHKSYIQRSKYLNIFLFSARVSIPQMLDNRRMAGCGSSDEDPYRFNQ